MQNVGIKSCVKGEMENKCVFALDNCGELRSVKYQKTIQRQNKYPISNKKSTLILKSVFWS